jgi:hypothetical protein
VPSATHAVPDEREVIDAFWIPLSHLRDARNARELVLELESLPRSFPSVHWGEHVIWGLTHRILTQLLAIAGDAGL